jgi:hypothetical protein
MFCFTLRPPDLRSRAIDRCLLPVSRKVRTVCSKLALEAQLTGSEVVSPMSRSITQLLAKRDHERMTIGVPGLK